MVHKYISDKKLGEVERTSEEINSVLWNGIISVYESTITDNALSGNFPKNCPDGDGVCGCARDHLHNAIKAEIPSMPISSISCNNNTSCHDNDSLPGKYAILDFLEFLHKNIKDPQQIGSYHKFYNHYHYKFLNNGQSTSKFREKINIIFSRNGIVFYLDDDGLIKRTVPESLKKIVTDIRFSTKDNDLNKLLSIAYVKFVLPKPESRIESLEKLWDAFERIKTYYEDNKKTSATTLISTISSGNSLFNRHMEKEFKSLTDMGNNFQIRHFERNKVQLKTNLHIDYLFYRMSALIHLCVESIKNG